MLSWIMYGKANNKAHRGTQAAKIICDFIKSLPMSYQSFIDVDDALLVLQDEEFYPTLTQNKATGRDLVRKKAPMLAKYIANFIVNELKLTFNDANSTSYELDEIKKTMIGGTLFDFGAFASQHAQKSAKQAHSPTSTRQPGQAPANPYKSSGPQSGNIINIIGQPGQKVKADTNISYCIEADKIGKNTPNAFIKPLDPKFNKNGVAEVFLGSGNGYTDCRCWFDDEAIAKAFLAAVQTKFGSKYTNIHISKAKSDQNGYFLVKTEFGDCAIKASKLNEALTEAASQEAEKKLSGIPLDAASARQLYDEDFVKYYN